MRVTVHGREAHVGLLHQGRNAFEDAIPVVAGLQRLASRVGRRRTRFNVTPDAARRSLMLIGGRVEAGSMPPTTRDRAPRALEDRRRLQGRRSHLLTGSTERTTLTVPPSVTTGTRGRTQIAGSLPSTPGR